MTGRTTHPDTHLGTHGVTLRRRLAVAALATGLLAGTAACGAPGTPGAASQAPTETSAVTADQATRIFHRVLDADAEVRSGKQDASAQIPTTYAGEGQRAAQAAVRLIAAGVQGKSSSTADDTKILATSRGTDYPRYIVGATTPAPGALPTLHLLVATGPQWPYRLTLSSQIIPGGQVNAFAPVEQGAPVVTSGDDMTIKPVELLKSYAAGLTAPQQNPPYEQDTFSQQVLAQAQAQAQQVADSADFRQTNQLMADPVVALRELNGDTLVLGVIERTSDYAIKKGKQLPTTPLFSAFVPGRTALVQQIRTQVLQFVVLTVPREGKAHLVAATEQVVGASGA